MNFFVVPQLERENHQDGVGLPSHLRVLSTFQPPIRLPFYSGVRSLLSHYQSLIFMLRHFTPGLPELPQLLIR